MLLQFFIIFIFLYIGEGISKLLSLPVPGTILGMLFLFISLQVKLLKLEHIEKGGSILIKNMAIFFIPPGVSLIKSLHLLEGNWIKIIFIMVTTTIISIGVTGKFIEYLIGRLEDARSVK